MNIWKDVPTEYLDNWREVFSNNKEGIYLKDNCPICNNKSLRKY
jgi:hypothetical protein